MIATIQTNVTFATAKTAVLDMGRTGLKEVMIFVPTLATDTYLTISMSYDGTTYLTMSMPDGAGSEYDVEIPSARCKVVPLAGARYITLTAPATNQTGTVYAIAKV